jgi:hypothetical protein
MSDRSNVLLKIGGVLAAARIPELLDALEGEVGLDWCIMTERVDLARHLRAANRDGSEATFRTTEVSGGQHEYLETKLREFGLVYYRSDDGYVGGWDASGAFWKPGFAEPETWSVNASGVGVLDCHQLMDTPAGELARTVSLMVEADKFDFPFAIDGEWPKSEPWNLGAPDDDDTPF